MPRDAVDTNALPMLLLPWRLRPQGLPFVLLIHRVIEHDRYFRSCDVARLVSSSVTLALYLMREQISPARALSGAIQLPGDKSISHRYGMLAAIAEGVSKIENYSSGADCQSTLACMQALGARVEKHDGFVSIEGRGLDGLHEPASMLDAGNSGSTIRMLSGILTAQPFVSKIGGDDSLSR